MRLRATKLASIGGQGSPLLRPSLDLRFADGHFSNLITFTRASNATQFNSAGTLVYAPNNWIRNNTMVGAVAGTPGTLPTNWGVSNLGTLTQQVVGTGTVNGINYVDIRFSGTTSTTQVSIRLEPNGTFAVPASNGQTWTTSMWSAIVGGGLTNIIGRGYSLLYWDNASSFLGGGGAGTFNSTATLTRTSEAVTIAQVGTAFIQPQIYLVFNSGVAIDITLRIGLPQLEIGSTVNEAIPTSGTAYQGPRLDYNPSTLAAQGLLIEEARTNSIRNNTMQGAVAGTPGTAPTNWAVTTTGGSITRTIVGTGTESGITYIDIRYVFSAGATATVQYEQGTQIAAANGQTWTQSTYVKLTGGSLTNISEVRNGISENDVGGTFLAGNTTVFTPTTGALSGQRYTHTRTLNNASTAFVVGTTQIVATGAADITLRIGLPQLELGSFATSVIPTTTIALTRSADVASVNTLSPWFNAAAGTLFNEVMLYALPPTGTFPAYSDINDGTTTNRIALSSNQFANHRITARNTAGILIDINAGGSISVNVASKWALAYANADYAASANGGAVVTSATAGLPSGLNQMLIGRAAGANQASGYLRRITYYPRRLSNAELVSITS